MQHQMTDRVKSETSHYVASTFEIFVMKISRRQKGLHIYFSIRKRFKHLAGGEGGRGAIHYR